MSNASTAGAARHDSDRATRLGIAFMLLAILMFALNDTLGKWLLGSYGVGQLLFIRTVSALLVMVPILMRVGWHSLFPASRGWLLAARALIATLEIGAFYLAVSYLPLADTITYWMAAPIYVAALSPFLLGEHVGWRRWTAIIVGFVGVLIALNPSAETLTLPALVSIAGSLLFTLLMITGRALRGTPDAAMVFWPLVTSGIAGALTIPFAWVTPALDDLALLALLGVVALGAHYFTNRSLALAHASTVTPYQYAAGVGDAVRLAVLRRGAEGERAGGRRGDRGGGALHLLPRAAAGADEHGRPVGRFGGVRTCPGCGRS
ncbi:DMT family transporter [Mesorhizobium sp. J428]|uniref:DMT family transporter n=1 Tax=Mesorhizobium sp. J428 TaxID=2898440 RepID=UPI0027E2EEC1|nr:DMT family transporter [Mesorhizobium sp. J428]